MVSNDRKPNIHFQNFTAPWEERKLGDLSDSFEYGLNAVAVEYDGKNKYIRITDIDEDSREFKTDSLTSPKTELQYAEKYKLTEGDILFARTGASVGKSYIYKKSDGLVYYAGFLIRARIKERYNPEFVFQNTLTSQYEKFIKVTSMRSGQPGVNAQEYSQYEIRVPSKPEQDKIAACLKNIDNLITLQQCKNAKLKNIKKSMLRMLFPGEGRSVPAMRFDGFSDPWEPCRFSDFVQRESAIRTSSFRYPSVEYEDVIAEEGRLNKNVRLKETQKAGIVFDGTQVLYGKLRPYLHNWLSPDFMGVAVGDWWVLRPIGADKKFLYRLIQTRQFDEVANQTSGSKMPRADWNLVSNTEFIIPSSLDEQRQIAETFDAIDNLINLRQHQLEKLRNIKRALLEKMFV